MERLFTPWRMAYVTQADQVEGCVLCRAQLATGDAQRLIVHTGVANFVVMNLFPYNGGHVMVAPKRHIATLGEATAAELAEMMALAQRLEAAFREAYKPDGINPGMNLGRPAGAGEPPVRIPARHRRRPHQPVHSIGRAGAGPGNHPSGESNTKRPSPFPAAEPLLE